MTRKEAIEILKKHHMWTGEPSEVVDVRLENQALQMAIDAIEIDEAYELEFDNSWPEDANERNECTIAGITEEDVAYYLCIRGQFAVSKEMWHFMKKKACRVEPDKVDAIPRERIEQMIAEIKKDIDSIYVWENNEYALGEEEMGKRILDIINKYTKEQTDD